MVIKIDIISSVGWGFIRGDRRRREKVGTST